MSLELQKLKDFSATKMQGLTVLFCLGFVKFQDEHDENALTTGTSLMNNIGMWSFL